MGNRTHALTSSSYDSNPRLGAQRQLGRRGSGILIERGLAWEGRPGLFGVRCARQAQLRWDRSHLPKSCVLDCLVTLTPGKHSAAGSRRPGCCSETPQNRNRKTVRAPRSGRKASMSKILLVEDNENNRDMLSRRLIRKEFQVVIA